jgi:hypothetical protein
MSNQLLEPNVQTAAPATNPTPERAAPAPVVQTEPPAAAEIPAGPAWWASVEQKCKEHRLDAVS